MKSSLPIRSPRRSSNEASSSSSWRLLTVAFAAVLWPFYGAVFWGGVLALMFEPLYRKFLGRMRGRQNLAALATLGVIVLIVVLPLALVGVSLVQEMTALYAKVKSGEVNFGRYFEQMVSVLPSWITGLLDRYGVVDLPALQAKLVAALTQRSESIAGRAVDIGGEALDLIVGFFIAMYLLFFLLRDGAGVARDVRAAIPLAPEAEGAAARALHHGDPRHRQGQHPGRRGAGRRSAASPSGRSACTRPCSGAW